MFFSGFIVAGSALAVEVLYSPPYWVHAVLWGPLILVTTLVPLRPLKGLMIALQYHHKAADPPGDARSDLFFWYDLGLRLKADKSTAQIPVVALTGHALAGVSDEAKKAGCDVFVTKPCLPEDLVKEIRRILDDGPKKGRRSGKYAKSTN